jgi:hypothetical protein
MSRWLIVGFAFLLTVAPTLVGAVQDDEVLPVTPGAGKYLPAASDLGPGWSKIWEAGIDPGADLFQEGVKAVYGGANGSRAVVYAWVIQDSTTAVRRSWESTAELLGNQRYEWASDYDWSQADEIDSLDPPAGCVESSRDEGTDPNSQFPAGLTLCAVDPDVIVLTIVSGELADESGYLASDTLVQLALQNSRATPTPDQKNDCPFANLPEDQRPDSPLWDC